MSDREQTAAHYETCGDVYTLTVDTEDAGSYVIKDCPCPKPDSPATCTTTED